MLSIQPEPRWKRWLRATFGQRTYTIRINSVQDPARARILRNVPERLIERVIDMTIDRGENLEIERER